MNRRMNGFCFYICSFKICVLTNSLDPNDDPTQLLRTQPKEVSSATGPLSPFLNMPEKNLQDKSLPIKISMASSEFPLVESAKGKSMRCSSMAWASSIVWPEIGEHMCGTAISSTFVRF